MKNLLKYVLQHIEPDKTDNVATDTGNNTDGKIILTPYFIMIITHIRWIA